MPVAYKKISRTPKGADLLVRRIKNTTRGNQYDSGSLTRESELGAGMKFYEVRLVDEAGKIALSYKVRSVDHHGPGRTLVGLPYSSYEIWEGTKKVAEGDRCRGEPQTMRS